MRMGHGQVSMRLVMATLIAGLILAAGCQHQETPSSTELNQRDQQELLQANAERLAGEDARGPQGTPLDTTVPLPLRKSSSIFRSEFMTNIAGNTPAFAVRKLGR